MSGTRHLPFQYSVLTIAIITGLTPYEIWALDLVQEPPLPTSKSAFVAPNVIISVDDSGSMDFCLNKESSTECIQNIDNSKRTEQKKYICSPGYTLTRNNDCINKNNSIDNTKRSEYIEYQCSSGFQLDNSTNNCFNWTGANDIKSPVNGIWPINSRRINVLKHSISSVISDLNLIPLNKIRLAWQAMNNGTNNVNSTAMNINSMRPIDALIAKEENLSTGKYIWTSNKNGNVRQEYCDPIKGVLRTNNTGTLGNCDFVYDTKIVYTKHRDNFLSFISGLVASGGTPSHKMLRQADEYMRQPLSKNSPWSTDPGGTSSKATEYLGCRRNYHIFLSDGRWTTYDNNLDNLGNLDNSIYTALNDRLAYTPDTDQTRIYSDTTTSSLADIAFKSWMIPLQDGSKLTDTSNLKPSKIYTDAPSEEVFTLSKNGTTKSVNLKKYWNPKYNPATWPHMVTYTIGFSEQATTWPGAPTIAPPTSQVPFGYDNGFIDLVTGWEKWPLMRSGSTSEYGYTNNTYDPVRSLDLWHAAINGRGRFYAVNQAEDLAKAFTEIIGKINEESAPLPDSIAGGGSTSGYNVSQNNAGIFASVYSPKDAWSGYITATKAIEPEEYSCPTKDAPDKKCYRFPDVTSGWEGKTTAQRLDALTPIDGHPEQRLVLSWSDSTSTGTLFKWPASADSIINLSSSQLKSLIGITSTAELTTDQKTQAKNIVNYIRGDRSLEGTTTEKPFRVRYSRQGDIVNSEIWYTGGPISNYAMGYSSFVKEQKDRIPMLYVGGNDGMLHGFSAKDGYEKIAYVPRGVIGNLKKLTDKDYQHQYYVDGSPMTGDIKDGTTWKTILVGTLGAGGKGYFLLDVTNPAGFSSANAANLVIMDRTRSNSETPSNCSSLSGSAKTECEAINDIGNITAPPGRNSSNLQETTQITRMNNGRWAVVIGNGYNSANQRPVLLIQYLDGDKSLKRIHAVPTSISTGSGNANDNGLAAPALVDLNGDGKTDIAYAGDNLGNLWKFDLTSANDTDWKVAFGDNKPLFTARGLATPTSTLRDQIQPITAPPIVRANDRSMTIGTGTSAKVLPVGGMMVAFGTGRNLTQNDRRTDVAQPVQTLYSVLDSTRYRIKTDKTSLEVHPGSGDCTKNTACIPTPTPVGTIGASGAPLAKQTITAIDGDFATVTATEELNSAEWGKEKKGWYLDFPATGERLLKPMQFYDGSNILAVYSETPSGVKNSESDNINESCVPVKVDTSAGSQFRTLINIMDGKRPTVQVVDYNGDGRYNAADKFVARAAVKTGTPILITKRDRIVDLTGGGGGRDTLARMPEYSMRPSWRQLK